MIKLWRLALGLATGAAVPVLIDAVQTGPLWPIALAVGTIVAAGFFLMIGLPLYQLLSRRQMLSVYSAVIAGGLMTILPHLLISISGILPGGTWGLVVGQTTLIEKGRLTADGWRYFFVWRPLMFLPMGLVGGLVAWLIAVGFHIRPPRKISEQA